MGTIIHETAPSSLLITDLTQIEKRTLFNFMAGCNSKQHMDINLYPEGTKSLMRETLREHPVCLWGLRGSTSKLFWRLEEQELARQMVDGERKGSKCHIGRGLSRSKV